MLATATVLVDIGRSLREGFFMFWETLWPLVLGFGLAGAVQAFVSRDAGPGPWGELIPKVEVPVRVANRLEWVRGEQQLLPRLARRAGVDLLHSLASTAPGQLPPIGLGNHVCPLVPLQVNP